jgi:hypothetical protein
MKLKKNKKWKTNIIRTKIRSKLITDDMNLFEYRTSLDRLCERNMNS